MGVGDLGFPQVLSRVPHIPQYTLNYVSPQPPKEDVELLSPSTSEYSLIWK